MMEINYHTDIVMQILVQTHESRKSVGSFIFMFTNGPFPWKTALDRKISLSTCEAEPKPGQYMQHEKHLKKQLG